MDTGLTLGISRMVVQVNTRELVLQTLLEINKEGQYGHIAIRNTLEKYQYLEKQERAFITRVCEGTQENQIKIDYMINQFSKIKVEKMKPVIREILRSSVYQMFLWIRFRIMQFVMKQLN